MRRCLVWSAKRFYQAADGAPRTVLTAPLPPSPPSVQAIDRISVEQAETTFSSPPAGELEGLTLREEEQPATKLQIPRSRLAPGGPPAIATVDDLRSAAMRRKLKDGPGGEAFGRGVDIAHEGFTLFPMDNDAEENAGFTTLGVFVADEAGSDSDSK